ncbi:bifunctional lysylphosphatidylglycerol flippase/synthetase MprF [Rhodococcus opacus]|uniref:bifunctional lysylphosphatidylglycerol flippase/synthetase MprF n=1 Tax=Rhodococcus opacus TaxID=37919 RepID=UPI000FFCBA12
MWVRMRGLGTRTRIRVVRVTNQLAPSVSAAPVCALLLAAVWLSGVLTDGAAYNLPNYLVTTVLVFLVGAPVERRVGSLRFAVGAIAAQVSGVALGMSFAALVGAFGLGWDGGLGTGGVIGGYAWILGVLMMGSASMRTLWRRRIRVGVLVLLVTMALFRGLSQDVVLLGAALTGLVLGPWMVGRSAGGARLTGTRREGRVLIALIVAASALGQMFVALDLHAVGPLAVLRDLFAGTEWTAAQVRDICASGIDPRECRQGLLRLRLSGIGPTLLSVMPTLLLLVIAEGLRRGRRAAWCAAIVAYLVLIVVSVLNIVLRYVHAADVGSVFYGSAEMPGLHEAVVPLLLPVAIVAVLLSMRRHFTVSICVDTCRRVTTTVLATATGLAIAYVALGVAARQGFDRTPTVPALLADVPERLVPPVYLQWLDPGFLPTDTITTLLFEWTGVVFWAAAGVGLLKVFVTSAVGSRPGAAERARELIRGTGGSSLSWMTTWRGNHYWFGEDGESFVAYRVISGVALTTGDPVGPAGSLRNTVIAFAEYCTDNGWIPCFYSVTAEVRAVTDTLGWGSVQVAEESVLPLGELAFTGKSFQDVRTALNRARKCGITAEWMSYPSAPWVITDQIAAISQEWVSDKDAPEMGFTLGGLGELDDSEVRCLIAVDEHRTVHGVTSWLPVHRDGEIVGWTLDFMRRRSSEGFRPTMEFLIASAALLLQEEGAQFLSLSGAPLAKINPVEDVGAMTAALGKLLDVLAQVLEPVYGFRSLLAFKGKFQPRYEPMFMTYADPAALPSIGRAIARAYLPNLSGREGFQLVRTLVYR